MDTETKQEAAYHLVNFSFGDGETYWVIDFGIDTESDDLHLYTVGLGNDYYAGSSSSASVKPSRIPHESWALSIAKHLGGVARVLYVNPDDIVYMVWLASIEGFKPAWFAYESEKEAPGNMAVNTPVDETKPGDKAREVDVLLRRIANWRKDFSDAPLSIDSESMAICLDDITQFIETYLVAEEQEPAS